MSSPVKPTTELTVKVTFQITPPEDQTPAEARGEFLKLFSEYLTNPEGSFVGDYGPEAWGGYAGPIVQSTQVTALGTNSGGRSAGGTPPNAVALSDFASREITFP